MDIPEDPATTLTGVAATVRTIGSMATVNTAEWVREPLVPVNVTLPGVEPPKVQPVVAVPPDGRARLG